MKSTKRIAIPGLLGLALCAAGVQAHAAGNGGPAAGEFKARLDGFEEVPALSSPGSGSFAARVRHGSIDYALSYQDLDSDVLQAHIHFGQHGVNGGVSAFLCTNLGNGTPGTPECPPSPGTVRGTITAEDVVGPAAQGIEPGEFAELLDAIAAGATYVNVHTVDRMPGEIRGQIRRGFGRR